MTIPTKATDAPTVLISWAHSDADWTQEQTEKRRQDVLRLAAGLGSNGIVADIDLYHASEDVDWTRWGPQRVREVDVVLIVASRAWKDAWEGGGDLTRNIGAGAEADALRSIYTANRKALLSKCRVLLLPGTDSSHIPDGLHGVNRHTITGFEVSALEGLVRDLTNQPIYVKPPIGTVPVLPPNLTYLTPEVAGVGASNNAPSPAPESPPATPADLDGEVVQLRAQLAALPEPLPGEGPHLPWFGPASS